MAHKLTSMLAALVFVVLTTGIIIAQEKKPTPTIDEFIAEKSVAPQGETTEEARKRLRALSLAVKEKEGTLNAESRKSELRLEKKARVQIEKEDKRVKDLQKKSERSQRNAHITGCTDSIQVSPRATGSFSMNSHIKIRTTNLEDFKLDTIEDENGWVVQDLCGGGAVTLFRARNWARDGNYFNFHYVAKGHFPNGTLGIAESPTWTLSGYDWSSGRGQQFETWNIRLQKVHPQR